MASITRVKRQQRVDKRLQVEDALLAAMEALIDAGASFTELGVEQLARQAGIARSTFYLHFADKNQLVERLARRVTAEMVEALSGWWRVADRARQEDLVDALDGLLAVYDRHRTVITTVFETAAYNPAAAEMFNTLIEAVLRESRVANDRLKAAGLLPDAVTRDVATALTLMVERSCHHLGRGASPQRRRQIAESLAYIVRAAMYRPSAAVPKKTSARKVAARKVPRTKART